MKLFYLVFLYLGSAALYGSDHVDGPITMKHRVGDLTDFYAFKSSQKGTPKIVLVQNSYPGALKSAHFSDRITYSFFLRGGVLVPPAQGTTQEVRYSKLARIDCTFKTPHTRRRRHSVSCVSNLGLNAKSYVGDVNNKNVPFKVFAGHRSDPFFMNTDWFMQVKKKPVIPAPAANNALDWVNVLSIIIEIDPTLLFEDTTPGLLALSVETTTRDKDGTFRRLDRIGRPEITNVSLDTTSKKELRDQFNWAAPYSSASVSKKFVKQLSENIQYYDRLDSVIDWPKHRRTELAKLLANDVLLFDWEKPCDQMNYFDIERSLLAGKNHSTCGGRTLEDDFIDRLYSLYINNNRYVVRDGVDKPFRPVLKVFPYLSNPVFTIRGKLKVMAARLLGIL